MSRSSYRQQHRQQGFTLLELLIAIGILAMLGVASALVLNSAIESEAKISARIKQLEQLQITHQLIRQDLEQIALRSGRDPMGDRQNYVLKANAQPDRSNNGLLLRFFRSGRRILGSSTPNSALERVQYRLNDQGLIRESSLLLDPASDNQATGYRQVLLDDVEQIRVAFYADQRWHSRWPIPNLERPLLIPEAVKIEFTLPVHGVIDQNIVLPGSL